MKTTYNTFKFKPSQYQKNIFDFIQYNIGNLVVEACAGSGKTSTLIHSINLVPKHKRILFCAFNKEIVSELKTKIGNLMNVDIKTIHSLGFNIITRNFKHIEIIQNDNKYIEYVTKNITSLSSENIFDFDSRKYKKFIKNICSLIDYSRYNLYETQKDIKKLIQRHNIEIVGDEINVVIQVLQWGKENYHIIDYGDMVWLPNVLFLKTLGFNYDYIFVDEAQDLSAVQRELLLNCQRMGTRYMFFGDENQSIYNFAGADIESFRKLKSLPNTTSLPLSISYRCAESIVKFAQNYVSNIEPNGDGRIGEVIMNGSVKDIQDGDMVLCRNNAPLIKLYGDLIKMGKKCYIRGKDIGVNLKEMLMNLDYEELNKDLSKEGVFSHLYQQLFECRNNEILNSGLDEVTVMNANTISNKLDMIRALEALSEGINTKTELINKIETIFNNDTNDGIALSTIHKAKGLETNNVFIVCPSLMPSKNAIQDWEKEQEKNLMYVAFTRSKDKLVFLSECGYEHLLKKTSDSLKNVEKQLNVVFNYETKLHVKSVNEAKKIVKDIQPIDVHFTTNKTMLGMKKQTNNLQKLINKRIIKKI